MYHLKHPLGLVQSLSHTLMNTFLFQVIQALVRGSLHLLVNSCLQLVKCDVPISELRKQLFVSIRQYVNQIIQIRLL
jgi:hypothetical protein